MQNNLIPFGLFFSMTFIVLSCTPRIYSFTALPATITKDDSVKINWKVRGKPSLLFHEKNNVDNEGTKFLEYTLVVRKKGIDSSRMIQVIVLPGVSSDMIVFATTRNRDTLIADGIKNEQRWPDQFHIVSVASASNRDLEVTHSGKTAKLDAVGTPTGIFEGTTVKGTWELRSLLSETEKKDIRTAPSTLRIKIIIKSNKQ
jgi:hypothetical protein